MEREGILPFSEESLCGTCACVFYFLFFCCIFGVITHTCNQHYVLPIQQSTIAPQFGLTKVIEQIVSFSSLFKCALQSIQQDVFNLCSSLDTEWV